MTAGKLVGNVVALAAVLGWLATAGVADAAKKKKPAGGAAVTGMVVRAANGKAVHGARVRVAAAVGGHHHKHVHVKRVGPKLKKKHHGHGHAGHHRTVHASAMTGPRGHFTIRNAGSGAVTLVAHKRGVGTGRVRTAAGNTNVAITLHKRHHAHSGVITGHARKAVHHRVAHKKAAGQHPANKKSPAAVKPKSQAPTLKPGG